MSIDTVINGKKLEKDNLIFEVLGCLDQCGVEIGAAKLESADQKKIVLTQIQRDLADFSSFIAQNEQVDIAGRLNWLEKQISRREKEVEPASKFLISGKSELEVRLNLARVAVRKAERRAVSLNRYQNLPQELLNYLNRLSWFLFLLAL